jgi:hypothetical protein
MRSKNKRSKHQECASDAGALNGFSVIHCYQMHVSAAKQCAAKTKAASIRSVRLMLVL